MAPLVWTLTLLVGAAWGQDQAPAPVRRQNSLDWKPMTHTSMESSILTKCDFEDDTRPLCDWSQMSSDDGDWLRTTGPSPTGTSGPPGGYPNGEGYYLHMDASTFPRGGVARLRSPDIWEQGPLCIHFAFHMFGLSWGAQLRLMLLRGRKHQRPNVLWKHVNTQSPSWMPTTVTVPADRDIPSRLMFEGIRGNTAYLDISLDGLSIRKGTCNRICMSQMCTFDTLNNLCGWSWVPTATGAKWTQKKGSSGMPGVGPDDDFSSPGSGYYMLLDPTNARPGQKAVLLSPLTHSSGCLTLSFYYIMRGRSAGDGLFAYASFLGNIRKHTLFSGHYGPNWQAVSVNYTGQGQIQFIVVGVFGEKPEPAIAVDSISISPCGEGFPQCNFEDRIHPFCDWNHVIGDVGHWNWGSKSVPTPISGPPREFPYGGEHYIYFDSIMLPEVGQSARLVSPPFCAPGDVCVEFAYHMYGLGEGTTLKLLLGSPAGSSPISLWKRVGSQSTGWVNSSVTIAKGHQQPMQLFLEATRGTSTAFVVAVNFILISHGPCRAKMKPEDPASSLLPGLSQMETTSVSLGPLIGSSEIIVPIFPIETTIVPTEEITASAERTTIPPEETTVPTAVVSSATEVTTFTSEVTTVTTEESTVSPEEASIPPEEITTSPEVTTVHTTVVTAATEMATFTSEVTTVSPEEASVPPEETTSREVTTVSSEQTRAHPEETTTSPEVTTVHTAVVAAATEVTTVTAEVTTVTAEVTTVPPEETTTSPEVTTVPTAVVAAATEVTTVTAEVTTVTAEVTTVSPEEASVPPEETTPTEVTTVPPEQTSVPPETTTSPEVTIVSTEVTTVTAEVTTVTVEVTTASPEETTTSPEVTTVPTAVVTNATEVTTVTVEVTTASPEETTTSPEVTTIPTAVVTNATEVTTVTTEVTTVSPEEASVPPEETTTSPEVTSVPPEETSTSPEVTTVPSEETSIPPEETSVPPEETSVPPEETSTSPEVTTVPPEETSVPPEETSVPPEETSVPPEETSVPPEETSTSPEVTTVPPEETSIPPEETATPPEGTFVPTEETVFAEQSTAIQMSTTGSCPPNAHLESCACLASCENPKPSCQTPCHPGCVCNPGFLFSSYQCINASSCNCFYSNKYYKPGEEWFSPNCTERCRCLPGSRMECQISQCGTYTVCLMENGEYECQPYDSFFKITASTQERGVEGVSSLDKVFITLPETTITMTSGRETLIGEQRVTLPAIPSNNIFVGLSGRFVELRTTFGLRVKWDGDQQLFVTVPSTYSRKLCGFCGNYDGDSSNDNQKPDGTRTHDGDELGKSWQLEEEENKECQNKKSPPYCDAVLERTMSGPKLCGQLVDPRGTFEACLFHIKTSFFLDNCVSDMCSFQGLQQMLCTHMSAMTAACQDAGYAVKPWRRPQFCPLVCPRNSRYSLCAKPCPDTCHPGSALQPCPEKCVEACECDPGFVLSGFECVPQSQCGCTSLEGRYFKVQEQWFNPDCKEICTCDGNNSVRCQPWKCRAQEVCSHKNGVLGCHAQGAATCIASGDPHYLTFDGALHHFMGTCTYVLTQPCWSNAQDDNFIVSVTNEVRDGNLEVSNVKAVHVQVFGLKVSLFKSRTVVLNNQRVALPVWPLKGRVTIRLSGIFVLLYTNFGLQVRYDGKHLVEVTVPSLYAGSLCGLCGNYNNNSLDDNLRPNGKPAGNSLLLGAAWKILEASEPGCFVVGGKSSSCEENSMDDAWTKKCAILMNPIGPFSNCHEAVPPQASFSSCVYGQCGTKGDTLALCRSLQAYASLCAQAGQVITWRNSTFCPLRCPPRSSYNPCANPCPATCLTLSIPRDCPTLPCVEGCECQTGHILSGTTCVPLRQCGCSDQGGSYHLLGESWYAEKTCTTLCTCSVHSNITCSQTACEANHVCLRQNGLLRCAAEMGECHISEDSQIVSFDGHSHPIQDMCTYIMVKVCHPSMNLPFFTISAKADKDTRTKPNTFSVYQLYIDIFNFRVTLQKRHSVLINDTLVTLPATTQIPGVSITTEDVYTIVTIKDEVQVKFESNNFLDIKISASSNGKVCGVCGNFNGEEEDELMTSHDELTQDEQEFMDSWKDKDIDPNCQKIEEQNIQVEQHEIMNGNCRPTDFEKAQANCQTALQGPTWAQCASRVSLKPFLLGCMNNFCEFRELFRALCEALQSLQDACQNQGLKPPIWRNSSFCPLECPAHSHYTNCLPSCPPSCLDPNSRCEGSGHKVPFTCKEGCICQPGYVLNNDKCVLKTHCGCKDTQGVFVPEGKNWISSSCTQNCVCIGGAIECQNFQCPSGAQCQDNEDGSSNCVKITLQCPAHSLYTNCLPPCPPSCSNLDGHCKGTNPKVPSACKEGCLCHPGFVLDKNKCVPRTHCGCKDTQGAFIPAGKTWMSTGCTQSCSCMRGAIRCRNFQCPPGTHCEDSNDGSSNCVKITLQCPAHSQYTTCLPSCLPSCLDPEGRCEGANTKAPSACKEGCVCQPGYVVNDEKCMLKIECSCQDTQGAFIPAGKSWISRGCSQSCNCMGGVIRCQKFKCPSGTFCQDNEDYTSNCVKTTMQCPVHSYYTNCVPFCLASCSDPEGHCEGISTKAPSTCKEGCVCEPGFVLHDGKCVLRIECGCKDAQGALIPADKTWINRGCTQTCTCTGGAILCRNFQCPSGTYCKDIEDGSSSCTEITLQCPAHSLFTNCLPSCLPSCSNLDGHCEGVSTKVPSTCKEGCLCHPGFVFNEDKCVPRVQCGCKDTQGTFIPAGKTWISRGCTQSCTCMEGTIQCQNFQCPQGSFCLDSNDGNSSCTKITLQCPAHTVYTNCLPSCLASCSDPDGLCRGISHKVPSTCKEGCVCEPGYVLHNDKCVLRIHCDCKDAQGALIPADKTWINRGCTQTCTCAGGAILCRNFQCPSGTYCKDIEDGNSSCTKITVQCPNHSHHTNCVPSCLASCSDPEGHCEGISTKAPSTCKEGCVCEPGFVLRDGKCVLRNHCGCKDAQGALIPANKTWINRGCTQSCTCVGGVILCRNFQCPSGTYCRDIVDGNSNCTKITVQCPNHSQHTNCVPSCLASCSDPEGHCEGISTKSPSTCKEGCVCEPGFVLHDGKCVLRNHCGCKDAQGALIPSGKTWISRGCTQSCACSGGIIQCQNFQCSPGTHCKDNNDGSSNCAKITLQCPANSHYTDCLPSCPPSCLDLEGHCEGTSPKVPPTCNEGCLCHSGFVLSNDKCIPRIQCDCKDAQGALIPAGKTWTPRGCSQSCTCTGGTVQCQNFQCPSETYCKDNHDGNSNCVKITIQCPDHSHFTDCLPSCQPSCFNPDGRCEGTSSEVPCKEGCICQPGYVLGNDKCVLKIECDCKDAHGTLIPAGKTWISAGCTQSCTCVGGAIQCRNFQCPQGTYCKGSNDGGSNCSEIPVQCPAHSHFTSCLPSCPPSCSIMDGHCEESSSKVPATCKEGCVCQPGYLLNNGKCVLRIQCGCRDAQGDLIPAGKTWLNKGCTESCNCMGGTVQCRTFQCPLGTHCNDSNNGSHDCVKITLQCPAHSRYTNCLPPCPPSCTDLDGHCEGTSPKVPSTCKEGCVCQPGYVLHNNKCVLQMHCGCKDARGDFIPAGKTWLSSDCTQSCTCMGGVVQCHSFNCPPGTQCQNGSDGNINCTKIINMKCPAHSRYTNCLPSCPPSCSDPEGLCGGAVPKAPSTCKEGCVCRSGFVLHNDKCVPRMQCSCRDTQGVLIPADKTWLSRGCTQNCTCLAGNIHCQNFQCPTGTHCKDNDDGNRNCAKDALQCPDHSYHTNCLPSCIPSCSNLNEHCEVTSPKGPSTCKEGCLCQSGFVLNRDKCVPRIQCDCKDSHGALIPAGKTWIAAGCSQRCTCMGGLIQCQGFQCPSGTQCQDIEDNSSSCVEIIVQCPAHSRYTSCLPSCLPSCLDPDGLCKDTSPRASPTCKEGCICQSGYILSSDKCIPRTQCSCKDAQGNLILAGKTWISSGCTQSCACINGAIQCQKFSCPSESHCQHSDDGSSTCASNTFQCPAHSHFTSCLPSCLPSCLNPDGHCEGTSTKVPAVCNTGCLCQPGYVLNNDKCVPRIQCGCKDVQGALIPENKTWITDGCTQSCTCRGGTIQCHNFKCPTGSHCQYNKDGSRSCITSALKCPAHSLYTSCLPSCLPTCSDPEGLCQGSSPRVPSTCKEGCFCRSGYVLHDDKCVLRIHCGCKDGRGTLLHTGQTWISTDCTRICTCKEGFFQCQNFQCPSGTHCQQYQDGNSNCVSNTMKCPANSLYTSCLPSCQPSCSNPNGLCEGVSPKVPSTCKEGCVCQPGYLLNEDKCVLRNQCGCKDTKGDLIPTGKTWISSGCTQNCTCMDGVVQCRNFICPTGSHCQHSNDGSSNCAANKLEKCTILGDPYYHTFDDFSYRFLGRMNYYLIKTIDKLPGGIEHLVIEGRNKISPKGSPTLHEVTTIVYGDKIQLQEGLVALVNNQKVAIPYNPNDHLRVLLRAQRLFLITDFEMVVDYDGKHSAVISLPTMYRGLIRGLCGNYDKDRTNDLMLPSGTLTSNLNVFGNSWEVKMMNALFRLPRSLPEEDGEEEESDPLPSECSPEQIAFLSSTQACRVVVDPQGPFAACHQIVAPEPFEQHCMSDMCTGWKTKEEEEFRCRVLSGYAIICQEAGANTTGWRDQTHCAMTCPANTVYQPCMTPCPASCAKFVTPKACEGPCVEGCATIPGYIYSDTQSLPVAQCGCTTNGIYYKLGDSYVTDDCSQHCTCASQGTLLCEPYGCRVGEACTVANFTRGCFRDSPCLQNPCRNDGRCQEQGDTFICHCDLGYGGEFCTEPRDIPSRKKLESSSLLAILPGVLVMLLVPVLLLRVYIYLRTAIARRRREKLLRRNRHRLEDTDREPTMNQSGNTAQVQRGELMSVGEQSQQQK
uniref:zonadhesin isoform X4 n=1 Tax=Myodes glareolus TaxID=447135 RepID=UPI002021D5D4|nr:zonadhesin isoform X4 [Myodes glareolus]